MAANGEASSRLAIPIRLGTYSIRLEWFHKKQRDRIALNARKKHRCPYLKLELELWRVN